MELVKILKYLDKKFPEKAMADWDKSGIQFYNPKLKIDLQRDIKRVFITLDLTAQAFTEASKFNADLIITRHPFIFYDLKTENNNLSKQQIIKQLLGRDIIVYSIHTNYDSSLNNNLFSLIEEHLKIKKNHRFGENKEGLFLRLKSPLSSTDFLKSFKKIFPNQEFSLGTNWSRSKKIEDFYLIPGAGGDTMMNSRLASSVVVTGEMKWNHWLYALDNSVQVLTLGHEMENHFSEHLKSLLKNAYPQIDFLTYNHLSPFVILREGH